MRAVPFLNWLPRKASYGRLISSGFIILFLISTLLLSPLALGQLSTEAASTKITLSGTPIGIVGGKQVRITVNVTDVTDSDGLAAFTFKIRYNPSLISIADSNGDYKADAGVVTAGKFLGSSGKKVQCSDGYIDYDPSDASLRLLSFSCVTLGPTPAGSIGNGTLATVNFTTGNNLSSANLDLMNTELVDNTISANLIPHTVSNTSFQILKCADFDRNGDVDLFNDIFGVANRFGMTSSSPGWDPKYDLDGDGQIDLFTDILGTSFQFGTNCL